MLWYRLWAAKFSTSLQDISVIWNADLQYIFTRPSTKLFPIQANKFLFLYDVEYILLYKFLNKLFPSKILDNKRL